MARTLTCQCGQVLDVEDFAPGDQVQCPGCDQVLTVPGEAESEQPAVAMAVPVDEEDDAADARGSAHATAQQLITPLEHRRRADRRASYAAQAKLKRIMIWPCLALGVAALGVAALGFYYAYGLEPKIEIVTEDDGMAHLYARVPKEGTPEEDERIEVRPDILPGDKVAYDADDNPVYTLGGEKLQYQGGLLHAMIGERLVPLKQSGFWFYEVDPGSGKAVKDPDTGETTKLDLPLVAQEKASMRYVPVALKGVEFYRRGSSRRVEVRYYKAEEQFATEPLGKFKFSSPPLGLKPAFFIWSGIPVGLILLLAGFFFLYESYFSKAAVAEAERREAEQAARQSAEAETP